MARQAGRSYYGEISDRLRRFLGLDGEWPVEIAEKVQPVIIAGDATLWGMNPHVGRRFITGQSGALAAAQGPMFIARNNGVVIDGMLLSATILTTFQLRFGTDPGGGVDQSLILDTASTAGERAGVFMLVAAFLAGVSGGNIVVSANDTSVYVPLGFRLNQGMAFQLCQTAGVPTTSIMLFGRVAQEL